MSFLRRGLGDGRRPKRDDRLASTRLPIQQGGISVPKRTAAPREKSQAHENSLFSGCGGGMARDRGGAHAPADGSAGAGASAATGRGGAGLAISSSISCLNVLCGLTSTIAGMTQAPHKPHDPSLHQEAGWRSQKSVSARTREAQRASNLWMARRRGRQKFRRSYGASSLLKRSPIPASPARWQRPATTSHQSAPAGEGSPVFREPA